MLLGTALPTAQAHKNKHWNKHREPAADAPTFDNPLVEQRADPWVFRHTDGYYYMMATVPEYDRLELRRAETIQGLGEASAETIWNAHPSGIMATHIWAPELHRVNGAWYVYFAAGSSSNIWDIRIYVLENTSENPLEGEWVEKGEMQGVDDFGISEKFALDATTFELRGKQYLIWAQKDHRDNWDSNLYIAEMENPWTLKTPQVMLTSPEYDWEIVRFHVNEGASVLKRNGRLFVTFSASGTGPEYRVGLLTAKQSSDPLDPASWEKSVQPVFHSVDFNSQWGTGHNSFTTTPDGTDVIIYHSRNYEGIIGDPLTDTNRGMRAKIFTWNRDGSPNFGLPPADGTTGPLFSGLSDLCVAVEKDSFVPGADVQQDKCKVKDAQMWTLHPDGTGYYEIKAGHNGQCLDMAWDSTLNGGNAIQWPCNCSASQQWTADMVDDSQFMLINRNSGKCLDVWELSTEPGGTLKQWDCTAGAGQLWSRR